ncbi:MAG: hypothetical protein J7L12_03880 [Desulfurococcales archaeon]|nr:hypothetical protein [Desulfurococcales archaeon]
MPSAVVSTAILVIAGVLMASAFAVAIISQAGAIDSAFKLASQNVLDKMKTSINIIYLTVNGSYFVAYVKNVGQKSVSASELNMTDVYLGNDTTLKLYVYGKAGTGIWNYTETVNDGVWEPGETIVMRIYNSTALEGPYYIKIVLPNGVSDEDTFAG